MFTVLVNGLLPYDSGKTWLSIALARGLMLKGFKVSMYKPIAAHSAWYQFSTVINSLKHGILVGEDTVKYVNILGLNFSLELVNPIDFMTAPPNPKLFPTSKKYLTSLENFFEQIVLARISTINEGTKHYLITANADKTVDSLKPWIKRLCNKLNPETLSITRLLKIVYSRNMLETLDYNLKKLSDFSDIIIVESFSNASTPYYGLLEKVNMVLTVTPGYVFSLNVEEFKKAVRKLYRTLGDIGLRTDLIIDTVGKVFETPIPPSLSLKDLNVEDVVLKIIKLYKTC